MADEDEWWYRVEVKPNGRVPQRFNVIATQEQAQALRLIPGVVRVLMMPMSLRELS